MACYTFIEMGDTSPEPSHNSTSINIFTKSVSISHFNNFHSNRSLLAYTSPSNGLYNSIFNFESIDETPNENGCHIPDSFVNAFITGFIITRVSLISMYLFVIYYTKNAWLQFRAVVRLECLALFIAFISFFANDGAFTIIEVASLIEIFGRIMHPIIQPFVCNKVEIIYPLDIYNFQSRLGVFILMALGQSFVFLLTYFPENSDPNRENSFLICCVVLLFSLATQVIILVLFITLIFLFHNCLFNILVL